METKNTSTNCGAITAVRGSVVDVRFDGHLPPIHSVLHAGAENKIIIEVLAQPDTRHVRGIALTITAPWNWVWVRASGKAAPRLRS